MRIPSLFRTCIPIPFVVPSGIYVPCEVRVIGWLLFILFMIGAFFVVKNRVE